jgi:hypothetical protein
LIIQALVQLAALSESLDFVADRIQQQLAASIGFAAQGGQQPALGGARSQGRSGGGGLGAATGGGSGGSSPRGAGLHPPRHAGSPSFGKARAGARAGGASMSLMETLSITVDR